MHGNLIDSSPCDPEGKDKERIGGEFLVSKKRKMSRKVWICYERLPNEANRQDWVYRGPSDVYLNRRCTSPIRRRKKSNRKDYEESRRNIGILKQKVLIGLVYDRSSDVNTNDVVEV